MATPLQDVAELQPNVEVEEEKRAGGEHGEIGSLLNRYLGNFVYPNKLGRTFDAQTSFKVVGNPPTRQPDVAFVKLERMPPRISGTIPFAPDLAIEIVSENDTVYDVLRKVVQYQDSGVPLIWVVSPLFQTVQIYRLASGLKAETVLQHDELDGENIIPGFKLAVSTLF